MMQIKKGVRLHGLSSQIVLAINIAHDVWVRNGYGLVFFLTSGIEGKHSRKSQHASGNAVDLRTWENVAGDQMTNTTKDALASELRQYLGEEYFVLVEKDHIHLHYKPVLVEFKG